MEYIFEGKARRNTFILMGVGLVLFLLGAIMTHEHVGQRLWTSIFISSFFFFGVGLAALFFIAVQYAAEAGWGVVFKRVMEAIASYLPIGAITLIIVFIGGSLHLHHIFHWMDPELYDPNSEHYDQLIAHKQPYLNQVFWWGRTLAYLAVYILFMRIFKKRSLEEDGLSATDKAFFIKNQTLAAIFLVFFGYTVMTFSWDWIMSVDTHWFSTIFGWYIFSGMWISGMVMMVLMTHYLKGKGLMEFVNDSHMHDMGKWVFGVSFLWTYLFFCQFMLYWYSNIPEEITYFKARIEDYTWTFWGTLLINFAFPMLLLMSKDAKRNAGFMVFVGAIIFFGHWMDVFMLVTPGAMKDHGTIGLVEVGSFLAFLGLFLFVVLGALSKRPLLVKAHPYLDESLHHHIN
ncbi:MAG: quinol:cytochrome C oxidoreductase [Flavobacteriales bacterium]